MKKIILIGIVLVTIFSTLGAEKRNNPQPVTVVDSVNLKKYSGLWYEIARLSNRFQGECARNVTARYELRKDGKLEVINKCETENGEINQIQGVAKNVDAPRNAKLKVSFVNLLGFNLFWGDYWIIALAENYEYAVVGHPQRKYGWVLSRSPKLSQRALKNIFKKIEAKGYDRKNFKFTLQRAAE